MKRYRIENLFASDKYHFADLVEETRTFFRSKTRTRKIFEFAGLGWRFVESGTRVYLGSELCIDSLVAAHMASVVIKKLELDS